MLRIVKDVPKLVLLRALHCSHQNCVSFRKQGKVLNKLMYGSDKNKRKWYGERTSQTAFSSPASLASTKGQGKESTRRLTVLNKLFMEQITDLMATGEYSEEIVGYGIQISRVRVSTDFHGVNVFWFASDSAQDAEIGRLLKRVAGGLRHELSQLRLIGQVPKLTFVKDKAHGLNADVDSALRKADYGEDYEFTNRSLVPRSEIKLQTDLPSEVRRKIGELEDEIEYPRDDHDPLPDMRHDVLGLNHGMIMNKIKRSLNKSKQAWSQYNSEDKISGDEKIVPSSQCSSDTDLNAIQEDSKVQFSKSLERRKFKKFNSGRKALDYELLDYKPNFEEEPEIMPKDDDFILEDSDHHKNRK
ncbi:putative ribosome-binding factor A, mitochondrial [Aedes albopictus]|uniref:Ribosome-binding factor A, mitochondrial n=1 Tax=Aedes albopictus TaxID=7160 RepID=A0ABM1Y2Y0_AEDAL